MTNEFAVRKAVDAAWTAYLATHRNVDVADERRSLLERHLHRRWEAHERDTDELSCSGLAYLERLPEYDW